MAGITALHPGRDKAVVAARPRRSSAVRTPLIAADVANVSAAALLVLTVVFNALLAIVNGHVIGIGNATVALVQSAITFAAIAVALAAQPQGAARWVVYGWLTMTLWVLLTIVRGALEPKIAGDILLIPAFATLGMCIQRPTLFRVLVGLQIALVLFVIWELFFPTSFGDLFKVRDYYVATRGFSSEAFWAGDDNLFLSSQRPGGRILTLGLALNRGSSLFLEPVTLGNWTVVVSVALATFWKEMSVRTRAILIVTNVLLLIGCDGRLAMGVNALILVTIPIYNRLPPVRRALPFLYLPAIFGLLVVGWATGYLDAEASYDDLRGRYANSINFLMGIDLKRLMGALPFGDVVAADSGWLHIILTQSIFGLVAFWVGISLMGGRGARSQRFSHAASVFFGLALPVSYSLLSIKSAAALWMILGAAMARDRDDG
jgi:putative polymerase